MCRPPQPGKPRLSFVSCKPVEVSVTQTRVWFMVKTASAQAVPLSMPASTLQASLGTNDHASSTRTPACGKVCCTPWLKRLVVAVACKLLGLHSHQSVHSLLSESSRVVACILVSALGQGSTQSSHADCSLCKQGLARHTAHARAMGALC